MYTGAVSPNTDKKIGKTNTTSVKVEWTQTGDHTLTSDPGLQRGPSRTGHGKDEYKGAPPTDYVPAEKDGKAKKWKSK